MFERLSKIARKLDLKPEPGEAVDDKGRKIPILVLTHGTHKIIAIEHPAYTYLVYSLDVLPADAALLAQQPPEIQQTLFSIVKREMAEGRSGYFIQFDESKDPPELQQIRIEQKLVIRDEQPWTVQRVADGVQELVVAGIRCILVLGQAFADVKTAAQTSARVFHPGMYR